MAHEFDDQIKNLNRAYINDCDLPELLWFQELIVNTIKNKMMINAEEGMTMQRWRRLRCAERNK